MTLPRLKMQRINCTIRMKISIGVMIMTKFNELNRKDKLEYIWDYYKIHIISTIIAILLIGYFAYTQLTRIDYVFNLTLIESNIQEDKRIDLQDKITKLVVTPEEKRKQAVIDVIPTITDYKDLEKLSAKLAVKEIDILILDKKMFNTLAEKEGLVQLDNKIGINQSYIKNNKFEVEVNGKKGVFGISAEGIKVLEESGIDTHDKVLAIAASSTHMESSIKVVNWFLNNK